MNTEAFYDYWRAWFAQPAEAKEPFRRVKENPCEACGGQGEVWHRDSPAVAGRGRPCPDCNGAGKIDRGNWYPPFSESPGYTGKPDPKEYFHWTLEDCDRERDGRPCSVTCQTFWDCHYAANRWLLDRGLRALSEAVRAEDCVLRILHYLPTPDGIAGEAHRDFDLLTVNVGGTRPGLEVDAEPENPYCGVTDQNSASQELAIVEGWSNHVGCDHRWHPREGGIHVGEMLEVYTNPHGYPRASRSMGQFNATPHRVRIPPNTERFAAVFFYLPPDDFVLRPGLTARQYLYGNKRDGTNGAMGRAGTAQGARR